jgi:hypothetical protein
MHRGKVKSYRSYLLRCWQEQGGTPGQPPVWRSVLPEVVGEQRRLAFGSFELMVDFLLDELMGSSRHQVTGE